LNTFHEGRGGVKKNAFRPSLAALPRSTNRKAPLKFAQRLFQARLCFVAPALDGRAVCSAAAASAVFLSRRAQGRTSRKPLLLFLLFGLLLFR